jgi:hypothetical protein
LHGTILPAGIRTLYRAISSSPDDSRLGTEADLVAWAAWRQSEYPRLPGEVEHRLGEEDDQYHMAEHADVDELENAAT